MGTVRIVVTLKPGVLDAQGQAVHQGLRALGYEDVAGVRIGRYIEMMVADRVPPEEIRAMCERFLANPLIEEWRIQTDGTSDQGPGTRVSDSDSRVPAFPGSREVG